MSEFALPSPKWNEIPQLEINGIANLSADNVVRLPSDHGDIYISIIEVAKEAGIRIQIGESRNFDYQMIKRIPKNLSIELRANSDKTVFSSQIFRVEIDHSPFSNQKIVAKSPLSPPTSICSITACGSAGRLDF